MIYRSSPALMFHVPRGDAPVGCLSEVKYLSEESLRQVLIQPANL